MKRIVLFLLALTSALVLKAQTPTVDSWSHRSVVINNYNSSSTLTLSDIVSAGTTLTMDEGITATIACDGPEDPYSDEVCRETHVESTSLNSVSNMGFVSNPNNIASVSGVNIEFDETKLSSSSVTFTISLRPFFRVQYERFEDCVFAPVGDGDLCDYTNSNFITTVNTTNTYSVTVNFETTVDLEIGDATFDMTSDCYDNFDYNARITINPTAYEASSIYRIYNNELFETPYVTFIGTNNYLFTASQVKNNFNVDSGEPEVYRIWITEQEKNELEQESPLLVSVTLLDDPDISGASITGNNDVCVDDYVQDYSYVGTKNEDELIQWDVQSGGTLTSSDDRDATVTWSGDVTSGVVRARKYKASDVGNCYSSWVTFPVTIRDDINYYSISSSGTVCSDASAWIEIADTDIGYTYGLYQSNTLVPGTDEPGDAQSHRWSGLADGTYDVKVETAECGIYDLGSGTVAHRGQSAAPTSITGTTDKCAGTTFSLTGNTGNSNGDWDWQSYNGSWSSNISGQNDNTLSHTAANGVTQYRARYNDSNGCESAWRTVAVHVESVPSAPTITGTFSNICVDEEVQDYAISGTADSYSWTTVNGSPSSGSSDDPTITWNNAQSSWSISATATNTGGSATCTSSATVETVTLRKDVNFYTPGGDDYVCNGFTGEVTLSDSQSAHQYALFQSNTEVPGTRVTGDNSGLSWTDMDPGTYEIRAYHSSCGWYSMGSHTINERSQSSAPSSLSGTNSICVGSTIALTGNTSNGHNDWDWQYTTNNGSSWIDISGQNDNTLSHTMVAGTDQYRARYEDNNGCESGWRTRSVTPITVPSTPTLSGTFANICVGDELQSYSITGTANGFSWEATNGSPSSGTGNSPSVTWNDGSSSWQIRARAYNSSGGTTCYSGWDTRSVTLRKDVNVYTPGGDDFVCNGEDGEVTLSDSQSAHQYALFQGSSEVTGTRQSGSGSELTWSNVDPGTYEIMAIHSSCGNYSMGEHTITERSTSSAPSSITGTTDVCIGSSINLTGNTSNGHNDWDWQYTTDNGSSWITVTGQNDNTLSHTMVAGTDQYRARYEDNNGCESAWRTQSVNPVSSPSTPTLSGTFANICVGDEAQSYTITGAASGFSWETTNGSPSSGTGTPVNVTWNDGSSSWQIRARAYNNSGAATCYSSWDTRAVTLRKDVEFHTPGGDENVCNGSDGEITLSDSQSAHQYALFQGSEVSGTRKSGSDSELTWSGIAPGTYEIRAIHNSCGEYSMGEHTINERSLSDAPSSISGLTDYCIGSETALTANTSNGNSDWDWQYFNGVWSSDISGENTNLLEHTTVSGISQYRARYLDGNGCESDWESVSIELVTVPSAPLITGTFNNICVDDELQSYTISGSADSYNWEATNGTPTSGSGGTVNITWNSGASSWEVRGQSVNTNGGVSCYSTWTTETVSLRKDIEYYTPGGSVSVCNGQTGDVTLSDSQVGYDYALFENDVEIPATRISGSNALLTWTGLPHGTFEIRLIHPSCGQYSMGSHTIDLLPVSDGPTSITGTTDICIGSEILLTANTGNSNTDWDWQYFDGSWSSDISGEDLNTIDHTTFAGISEYRARYLDADGCESEWETVNVTMVEVPETPSITGITDVCVNDYIQDYTVTGDAESYQWITTHGTPASGTGSTATIRWDETQSSGWQIEFRGVNTEGDATCEGAYETLEVTLRDDISYFNLSGDDFVCTGNTGSISLSGSQNGRGTYVLYIDGVRSNEADHAKPGTGSALVWNDLEPNLEYTIVLETSDCLDYEMNGSVEIDEYALSSVPIIITPFERCGEGSLLTEISAPSTATTAYFYRDNGNENYSLLGTDVIDPSGNAEYTFTLIEGDVNYAVSYLDQNGCESTIAEIEATINAPAEISFVADPAICEGASPVPFSDFILSGTVETISGQLIASGNVNPVLATGLDEDYPINYTIRSEDDCTAEGVLNIHVASIPEIQLVEDEVSVCIEQGRYDASLNVVNSGNHSLVYSIDDATIENGTEANLNALGVGVYRIYVDIENDYACTNQTSFLMSVDDEYDITVTNADLTFCPSEETIDLETIFNGFDGEFNVNGMNITDGQVDIASQTNEGFNTLIFTEATSCANSHIFSIRIYPQEEIDFGTQLSLCSEDEEFNLNYVAQDSDVRVQPIGGTWSGSIVNAGTSVNPSVIGTGEHDVTYTVTDGNGCQTSDVRTFIVNATPDLVAGPTIRVCSNIGEEIDVVEGSNIETGVVATHDAVVDNLFDASLADIGTNYVTLSYTNSDGCTDDEIRQVIVSEPTAITQVQDFEFCMDEDPINLADLVVQKGGDFSAEEGVSGDLLIPSLIEDPGAVEITYTLENERGCISEIQFEATAVETFALSISDVEYCEVSEEINLFDFVNDKSGSWSGSGVFNTSFVNPESLGDGNHYFNYTLEESGDCSSEGELKITVHSNPDKPEIADLINVCEDEDHTIEINNGVDGIEYQWLYAQNDFQFGSGRSIVVNTDDDFEFYVLATNQVACSSISEISEIESHLIDGVVSVTPSIEVDAGDPVQFKCTAEGSAYDWEFTGGYTSSMQNPVIVFNLGDTTIDVSVLVTNDFGCEKEFIMEDMINVVDPENIFSSSMEDIVEEHTNRLTVTRNATKVTLFPNPVISGSTVNVGFESIKSETVTVKIFNLQNLLLSTSTHEVTAGEMEVEVALDQVDNGFYIIWMTGTQWSKPVILAGIKNN